MSPIIEARGLTERSGDVRALDHLDLVAKSGLRHGIRETQRAGADRTQSTGHH